MNNIVETFVESVIADRSGDSLTDDQCELAIHAWDVVIDEVGIGQPMTAPGHICADLDLPRGSNWQEALAAALDACDAINGSDRLNLLQTAAEWEA
jgi:hypothetical protein